LQNKGETYGMGLKLFIACLINLLAVSTVFMTQPIFADLSAAFAVDITRLKSIEKDLVYKNHEYEALNEELKQLNEELYFAKEKAEESDRLKTKFLNNMSHEVRTPMNGIIGFSEMLDNENITEEKRMYYSKIIRNSSYQLLRIINDILEISTLETRQEKVKEEQLSLNDFLMELFEVFNIKSKEQNIPLRINHTAADQQHVIITDKSKLHKILSNLLHNAIKFTPEGSIEIGYIVKDNKLTFYVKDTGIGISPENKEFIFERFAQEEKEISQEHGGLGLGLSIAKENARLLEGTITVESEKGKGSTFFVTIPYKPAPMHKKVLEGEDVSIELSGREKFTILIAEDEEINYLYFESLFEQELNGNYTLIHAKNGKEAVDVCIQNDHIDVVLMDLKMPVMNGFEATEKIKSILPNLPVIAQTAYSTESDRIKALDHGCDDFISKPLKKNEVINLLRRYLRQ